MIHEISRELAVAWWDKLLCAVFSFEDDQKRPVHWVYHYKWGAFYQSPPQTAITTATPSANTS